MPHIARPSKCWGAWDLWVGNEMFFEIPKRMSNYYLMDFFEASILWSIKNDKYKYITVQCEYGHKWRYWSNQSKIIEKSLKTVAGNKNEKRTKKEWLDIQTWHSSHQQPSQAGRHQHVRTTVFNRVWPASHDKKSQLLYLRNGAAIAHHALLRCLTMMRSHHASCCRQATTCLLAAGC
jgi:hypothetical protein